MKNFDEAPTSVLSWPSLPEPAPSDITIVGLGPGMIEEMSLAAWQALISARRLLLRTRRHPCVAQLAAYLRFDTCDELYEAHAEFADVYAAIARRVVALGREAGGVVYAAPGHPWVGETATRLILDQAQAEGLTARVVGSASFLEACAAAIGLEMMDGSQVVDAMLLAHQHHPKVETGLPLLIGQLYARWLASEVKLTLMNAYPDDHLVTLIHAAGAPQQRTTRVALHELDHRDDFDHLTTLYVPPLEQGGSFSDLLEIVAHLRAPEGCLWDQEQTLESLRQDLLGECVEVLEAIDAEADGADNSLHIAEELGDLFMVAAMMGQIAGEEGRFKLADVTRSIVAKLIRRHPHVFGETVVENVQEVLQNWEAIKAAEKAEKGQSMVSPLEGAPAGLPALEKARKLQSKAAKAGLLDRAQLAATVAAALARFDAQPDEASLGELLWQLVAQAGRHGLNAEDALRAYTVRFRQKYISPS